MICIDHTGPGTFANPGSFSKCPYGGFGGGLENEGVTNATKKARIKHDSTN